MTTLNSRQHKSKKADKVLYKRKKEGQTKMCKIMAMAGIKPENRNKAWEFAYAASEEMSFHPERDGIGYAAMTSEGALFGERWMNPKDAFVNRYEPSAAELAAINMYKGAFVRDVEYNKFGDLSGGDDMTSIILHTRFATTPKALYNVHPFVQEGTALIHNGVIGNYQNLELKTSTCDSEAILTTYMKENVDVEPENIEYMAAQLAGSYACAVLGTDGEGHYLDVFKNNSTSLVAAFITELGVMVFCTNMSILNTVCNKLKYTIEYSFYVRPGKLIRMDQATGAVKSVTSFNATFNPQKTGGAVVPMNKGSSKDVDDKAITVEDIEALSDPFYASGGGYRNKQ